MKRICLGTIITLLYQSRIRSSYRPKTICGGLFAAYGLCIENYNPTMSSHLKCGHDNAPDELVIAANKLSIEEISKGFEECVLPLIHHEKHEALFRAIKDILRTDSIPDSIVIGKIPGYEKCNILKRDSFYESMLLANVVTYAITATDNKEFSLSIKEIDDDFVDSFVNKGEPIHFISKLVDPDQIIPLKRTLKDSRFDRIFKKATEITVADMGNPTKACVFYIDPNNCKFSFRELKDFIITNIGSYVFSRARKNQLLDMYDKEEAIGSKAILKFLRKYRENAESVLGEIMLYIFMEQELGAPKIMSRIELDEYNHDIVSKSDGIHLLSLNQAGEPIHQLVFGASDIVGDLNVAIDRALGKIVDIEANSEEELMLVESTTQNTIYDPNATKYMVDLMKPHKGNDYAKPDMAFSVFVGYTIRLDNPERDSQKFRTAVKEQLIKDISKSQPHIVEYIKEHRLDGYSFYFYVFPFNDAPNEKVSIINEILDGGGVY